MKYYILLVSLFFIVLNSSVSADYNPHTKPPPKITVVGAGLAGLTSAYRLQKLGHTVEVYEARNRPGGRVYTAYFGDSYEELGGQSLDDGGDAEYIIALIQELGLKINAEIFHNTTQILFNDQLYPFSELFNNGPIPNNSILQLLRTQAENANSLGELIDPLLKDNEPLRRVLEIKLRGWEGSSTHALSPKYLDDSFWYLYCRTHEMSKLLAQGETPKKLLKSVVNGNSSLVKALANHLQGHIHYNHPLRKITKDSNQKIWLHFDGDKSISTDYLILAMPCSTLRDVQIDEGIIPEDQLLAIQTLQYGTNAKIIFPIQWKNDELPLIGCTETVATWFNPSRSLMMWFFGGPPGIFNHRSKESLSNIIHTEISSIQKLYPNIEFPTLDPTVVDDSNNQYEQPVGISWINEEFSKGSYCNYGVDQFDLFSEMIDDHGETVRKVFRSIDEKILLTGEHAARYFTGTMEGAVESGETTAIITTRIIEAKNNS